jgi:hypothetical protein
MSAMEELETEEELEGYSLEDEGEAEFLNTIMNLAQKVLGSPDMQEAEAEAENELEDEDEDELEEEFANPQARAYPDALMEHLGHLAAEAESEAEAEAFIAAAIPLAAQLLPKALPLISKAAPKLIKAAGKLTRTLRRNPRTRKLVRTVPRMIKRTVGTMAKQSARGRRVTPATATRTFRRQAAQVVGNPAQCAHAWRSSKKADRRFHRVAARPTPPIAQAVAPSRPLRTAPPVARPAVRRPVAVSGRPVATSGQQCICCGAVR